MVKSNEFVQYEEAMKNFIKIMRIILFAVIGISLLWNILCLSGILPLKYYTATFAFVMIPSVVICFRTLFFRAEDVVAYIGEASKGDRVQAVILLCLIVTWVITIIACFMH